MVHQQGQTITSAVTTRFASDTGSRSFQPKRHQLVVAETRQRAARPDVEEQNRARLSQEPERPLNYRLTTGMQAERADHRGTSSVTTTSWMRAMPRACQRLCHTRK